MSNFNMASKNFENLAVLAKKFAGFKMPENAAAVVVAAANAVEAGDEQEAAQLVNQAMGVLTRTLRAFIDSSPRFFEGQLLRMEGGGMDADLLADGHKIVRGYTLRIKSTGWVDALGFYTATWSLLDGLRVRQVNRRAEAERAVWQGKLADIRQRDEEKAVAEKRREADEETAAQARQKAEAERRRKSASRLRELVVR